MKKLLTLFLVACTILSGCAKGPKDLLLDAYPESDHEIIKSWNESDAEFAYEIYNEDTSLTILELCDMMIVSSENTPKVVKNSIKYFRKNFTLTNAVFLRDGNCTALYDLYLENTDTTVDISYQYEDGVSASLVMTVKINQTDYNANENNALAYLIGCVYAVKSIDSSLEDGQLAFDVVMASIEGKITKNGYIYKTEINEGVYSFQIKKA